MTEDLSERRRVLLATRAQLVAVSRKHPDRGVSERAKILIHNIDLMLADPSDKELEKRFALNAADLERYKRAYQ